MKAAPGRWLGVEHPLPRRAATIRDGDTTLAKNAQGSALSVHILVSANIRIWQIGLDTRALGSDWIGYSRCFNPDCIFPIRAPPWSYAQHPVHDQSAARDTGNEKQYNVTRPQWNRDP